MQQMRSNEAIGRLLCATQPVIGAGFVCLNHLLAVQDAQWVSTKPSTAACENCRKRDTMCGTVGCNLPSRTTDGIAHIGTILHAALRHCETATLNVLMINPQAVMVANFWVLLDNPHLIDMQQVTQLPLTHAAADLLLL